MKLKVDRFTFDVAYDNKARRWYTNITPIQGVMAEAPTLPELHEKLAEIIIDLEENEQG